jgi:hypothetical protein
MALKLETFSTNSNNRHPTRYAENDPINFVDPSGYSIETFVENTKKNYRSTIDAYKSTAGKVYKAGLGITTTSKIIEKGMISPVNAAKSILKPNGKLTMQNGVSNSGVPGLGGPSERQLQLHNICFKDRHSCRRSLKWYSS